MVRVYAVLLLILLFPATATAGWKVDRAQAIAEHVWDYDYGCDYVSISRADPEQAFSREALAVQAARGRDPLAWTTPGTCAIYLNATRVQRWGMGWMEMCSAVIHEYGHLAGHEHSTNPRSIMYPDYRPDRRCRRRGRPYLERYELQ